MDDYDDGEFYKEAIGELIEETDDLSLLDLVYKILLGAKSDYIIV